MTRDVRRETRDGKTKRRETVGLIICLASLVSCLEAGAGLVVETNALGSVRATSNVVTAVRWEGSVPGGGDEKRDLTNNVAMATSATYGAWSKENLPSGVTWDDQPFMADDGLWTWHYVDGSSEGYSQGEQGEDDNDTFQTFGYGEGFTSTRTKIAVAISNDVYTTYAFVTNAVAHAGGGLTTNDVDGIIASSNLCTVAAAQAMTNGCLSTRNGRIEWDYDGAGITFFGDGTSGSCLKLYTGMGLSVAGDATFNSDVDISGDVEADGTVYASDFSTYPPSSHKLSEKANASTVNALVTTTATHTATIAGWETYWSGVTNVTYDFNFGTNFTKRLFETLTNVIDRMGGKVTNPPTFN